MPGPTTTAMLSNMGSAASSRRRSIGRPAMGCEALGWADFIRVPRPAARITAFAVRFSAASKALSAMPRLSYPSGAGRVKQGTCKFNVEGLRAIMAIFVVTGGAGFIGSHLVDALLAEGHEVRVIDDLSTGKPENLDPRATLIQADICNAAALQTALQGAGGCFHLAAIASVQRANEDWPGTHRVNLTGSIHVFDACRAARLPVVYASSAAVYGNVGDQVAHEGLPCVPQTAYGADKYGSELHAAVGWGVHGVPSFGMRFFNVYGPRQDPASPYSGVISIFADRVARGLPITVHGDGGQTRDFIFVADVVAHLRAAMAKLMQAPGAYVSNVCTSVETSVLDLGKALGASEILHGAGRAGDIRRSVGSAVKAVKQLGVAAKIPLVEGLKTLAF
jgi:UDP-glucose 4-epimerase